MKNQIEALKEKEIEKEFEKFLQANPGCPKDQFAYFVFKGGFLSNEQVSGNQIKSHFKSQNEFLAKVKDDEPIFILRGQDNSSPQIILYWIAKNLDIVSEAKLKEAFYTVLEMRRYENRRNPD